MKRYLLCLLSLISLTILFGLNGGRAQAKGIHPIRLRITNTAPMRNITGTRNNLTEEENLNVDTKIRDVSVNHGKIKSGEMSDFFWAPWMWTPINVSFWDFSPNNNYVGRAYLTVKNLNRKKWYTFIGPTWDMDDPRLQRITMKPDKRGEVRYLATDFYFNYDSPIKKKSDVWFKQLQKYAPACLIRSRYGYVSRRVRTLTAAGHPTYFLKNKRYLKPGHRYHFIAQMKVPHHGLCYQLKDVDDQYWVPARYVRRHK